MFSVRCSITILASSADYIRSHAHQFNLVLCVHNEFFLNYRNASQGFLGSRCANISGKKYRRNLSQLCSTFSACQDNSMKKTLPAVIFTLRDIIILISQCGLDKKCIFRRSKFTSDQLHSLHFDLVFSTEDLMQPVIASISEKRTEQSGKTHTATRFGRKTRPKAANIWSVL